VAASWRNAFPTRLAVALLLACLIGFTWYFWPIRELLFELYAIAIGLVTFLSLPPIFQWLGELPRLHCLIVFLLFAAVVRGHFTFSTRTYFPFVAWNIFAAVSNQETVFCRELIGTTASQKKVRLLVEQLYPSIVQFDLPPSGQSANLDLLVSAMARTYNAHHANDPLREVDLMLMAVKLHPPPGQTHRQPSCEFLQHFDLSPGRSS